MNDITALRGHLFETLQALKDKTAPMDIDRAKAISDVAQTIINSAKVEVDFLRHTGLKSDSNFIPADQPKALTTSSDPSTRQTASGTVSVQPVPAGNVFTHRMRG